ncbi:X-BOX TRANSCRIPTION FACTOR-RELATED [Salix purpurea]|uniref:X-BOX TRANSCRIPTION FACTOR-RELATED n=1 Tax=Salix purpurea TaxID=77065 RepID=A0A9Q0YWW0_SALPP|nr:X-BOX TRANSCRIPTION FACTOR-RELATED [Salix purpurea]
METSTKPKARNLSSQASAAGRPQQAVKFARRTSSGRIVSFSHDEDLDLSGDFSGQNDYINYTVVMPPTPDNQPAWPSSENKSDEPTIRFGSEAQNASRQAGEQEDNYGSRGGSGRSNDKAKMERRMSIMKSNNRSILSRSQTGDFDHNRWLFETRGTYGVGNAYWSDQDKYGQNTELSMSDFLDKPWKPLSRKIRVPAAILSPYRILVVIRLVLLCFFLGWRVQNPNRDAMWLWGLSIVCEIWFAFSWLLDIFPKYNPINRSTDLAALRDKFEQPSPANPHGRSDLPGVDVFVSTADPDKEPPLVTANTLSCYISDDGGAILTFEAMAEAVKFAEVWVPFCRKHDIDLRNPDSYFNLKTDHTKNKKRPDFVKDRRWMKREYDEFKVRINGLPEAIRRRSKSFNSMELKKAKSLAREKKGGVLPSEGAVDVPKATWMADGTQWPGTWLDQTTDHKKGDHAGILQVMTKVPENEKVMGQPDEKKLDFTGVDIRIPMFAYVSREKRPGFDHNKKAGAMNALVRASAFPQRFEGIDPSDRYANHNTVFFDGSMRALDGLQGPVYVGTGCMFRRYALYGFLPPRANEYLGMFGSTKRRAPGHLEDESEAQPLTTHPDLNLPKKFGNSATPPGALLLPRPPLDAPTVAEAIAVISCWYEDKTDWGDKIGWIYGSVTEDVVTGYRMHNRGWRSVYCVTKRDAFRGTAPINLTDRLHQVLRWATGSVEIFFSKNNALFGSRRLKFLQRIAYLNVGIYPFTSFFLVTYCFLPALSLFTGTFIVQSLDISFLLYLLTITVTLTLISLLEIRWSGVGLEEWWRNEQFWAIGGTSAHLVAVIQGLLKVVAGVEISFTLTSKSAGEDEDDIYADLYIVKWTGLFLMPLTIIVVNLVAIVIGCSRTLYSEIPEWGKLMGGLFFSFWVLSHMYPFVKGLLGRRGRVPTIVYVWSGLVSITVSLLWISITSENRGKLEV